MNENKQISSRARKLLPSAVWANVRWKRDGYYRTSPNQNRRWLVVGFRIRPISLGKSRRFYVHRPAPFRGFATRTKKKKKKKADLRRERGGSSEPPEPPLRTGLKPVDFGQAYLGWHTDLLPAHHSQTKPGESCPCFRRQSMEAPTAALPLRLDCRVRTSRRSNWAKFRIWKRCFFVSLVLNSVHNTIVTCKLKLS